MPHNWKTYQLGDIAKLRKKTISPKNFNNEKYLGLEHIGQGSFLLEGLGKASDASSNKSVFKSGDILYGKIRPYFKKVYRPKFSGICSTDILVIKSIEEGIVCQNYLHQIIKTQEFTDKAVETSSGTKMPRADWKSLEKFEINLPPLQEQQSIASILSSIDDKIENNLAINKTLEEMAMTLYKHWFVDFGPFQDGEFVESELGMIPKGWEVKKLGDFIKHKKGFAFKSNWYQQTGEIIVRVSDTTHNSIDIKSCERISSELASNYQNYSLKTNDVVIATVGSWPPNYASVVGKVIRVPITANGALLNQNAVILNMSIDDKIEQGLLYCTLKNERFLKYIVNSAQGSANQASIKLTDIYNYLIPIGENLKIEEFSIQIELYISQQNSLIEENQTLTQLRDTLLPQLITGTVQLKEFGEPVEEVV
jgi:type I restriction enzyme S subunit